MLNFERIFIFLKFRKLLDSKLKLATKLGDAEAKIKQLTEGSKKAYWLESLNQLLTEIDKALFQIFEYAKFIYS